jgi:hypothetical protein
MVLRERVPSFRTRVLYVRAGAHHLAVTPSGSVKPFTTVVLVPSGGASVAVPSVLGEEARVVLSGREELQDGFVIEATSEPGSLYFPTTVGREVAIPVREGGTPIEVLRRGQDGHGRRSLWSPHAVLLPGSLASTLTIDVNDVALLTAHLAPSVFIETRRLVLEAAMTGERYVQPVDPGDLRVSLTVQAGSYVIWLESALGDSPRMTVRVDGEGEVAIPGSSVPSNEIEIYVPMDAVGGRVRIEREEDGREVMMIAKAAQTTVQLPMNVAFVATLEAAEFAGTEVILQEIGERRPSVRIVGDRVNLVGRRIVVASDIGGYRYAEIVSVNGVPVARVADFVREFDRGPIEVEIASPDGRHVVSLEGETLPLLAEVWVAAR